MKVMKNFLVSLITVTMMLSGFTFGVFADNTTMQIRYDKGESIKQHTGSHCETCNYNQETNTCSCTKCSTCNCCHYQNSDNCPTRINGGIYDDNTLLNSENEFSVTNEGNINLKLLPPLEDNGSCSTNEMIIFLLEGSNTYMLMEDGEFYDSELQYLHITDATLVPNEDANSSYQLEMTFDTTSSKVFDPSDATLWILWSDNYGIGPGNNNVVIDYSGSGDITINPNDEKYACYDEFGKAVDFSNAVSTNAGYYCFDEEGHDDDGTVGDISTNRDGSFTISASTISNCISKGAQFMYVNFGATLVEEDEEAGIDEVPLCSTQYAINLDNDNKYAYFEEANNQYNQIACGETRTFELSSNIEWEISQDGKNISSDTNDYTLRIVENNDNAQSVNTLIDSISYVKGNDKTKLYVTVKGSSTNEQCSLQLQNGANGPDWDELCAISLLVRNRGYKCTQIKSNNYLSMNQDDATYAINKTINNITSTNSRYFAYIKSALIKNTKITSEVKLDDTIETPSEIKTAAGNNTVVKAFDIDVNAIVGEGNDKKTYALTELNESIDFRVSLDNTYDSYYVLRLHDGQVDNLGTITNGGKFSTNKFSEYAIVGVKNTTTTNPAVTTPVATVTTPTLSKTGDTVTSDTGSTVTLLSTGAVSTKLKNVSTKTVKVPSTVTVGGKSYKVTTLKGDAFDGKVVKSVTLPKSITKLNAKTFAGDKKLTSIKVNSKKLTIGKNIFKGISKTQKAKIKVTVSKNMSKKNFYALRKALMKQGIKYKNIKRK